MGCAKTSKINSMQKSQKLSVIRLTAHPYVMPLMYF